MFKKKQAMKRGGAVKKRGGGMMGPKKKRAGGIMKKRGGGMMEKMMGGGMMGPKKKMAKGGKVRGKNAMSYLKKMQDSLKGKGLGIMPTGRDAAAKKVAGKSKKVATMIGKFKQGKGNPAGKDLSSRGKLSSFLKRRKSLGGKK